MDLPKRAVIREVGPRDGFQNESAWIDTADKIAIVDELSECHFPVIEVTSFTHPKWIPQLRDAEEVVAKIQRKPGTIYSGLIPNLRGAQRAVSAKMDRMALTISASEAHNQKNFNMSIAESLAAFGQIIELANVSGIAFEGAIAMAFGCPMEGEITVEQVSRIAEEYVAAGVPQVQLADTTGMANPNQVEWVLGEMRMRFPDTRFALHLHNTRGMGLANALVGLSLGISEFDTTLGGLGGCPFAPGATGNIDTEDMVHMLHEMGVETGIDLDRLIALARHLEKIIGRALPGAVMHAGKRSDLHMN
jgi:hydroxymethylglutaryl-CoA lyase